MSFADIRNTRGISHFGFWKNRKDSFSHTHIHTNIYRDRGIDVDEDIELSYSICSLVHSTEY